MPASLSSSRNSTWLFECAWEVANRVGGIYTVIRTKVPITVVEYARRYVLLGPLNHASASLEVEAVDPATALPDVPELAAALDAMRSRGIHFLFGRWLIEGAPFVLLFDIGSSMYLLESWKADLYANHSIPSPPSDRETNDAIAFGYLAAWFLGEFTHRRSSDNVLAHFHEWLAGVALPLIKKRGLSVATVFTTHATLLGRYICAGSGDFYNNLQNFDVDREAGHRGIYHRYCIERAAAHSADTFTTVSHITAFEAEHLLKRRPDGVVPNGLNLVRFAAVHEFQNLHAIAKEKIHDFVRGHFYGQHNFDLDNTLYFFTAGRYEYRNKGTDMFLEALARLNERLMAANSTTTVVAFIIMPAPHNSFNIEALKGQAVIKQLKDTVNEIQRQIGNRIFESVTRGKMPLAATNNNNNGSNISTLLLPSEQVALKRRMLALRRETLPPVVTHNLVDDANDAILGAIRRLKLFNSTNDRVKVVFHPEFMSASSPLFGLEYDEFVRGCHLGVFPSYYEPWGYTPAECTVMGVPSITTNLSGFGGYMTEILDNPDDYGIFIVDRLRRGVEDSVNMLVDKMHVFCTKSRRQRINLRNRTERLSDLLDWKRLGLEYVKARHLALRRKFSNETCANVASELGSSVEKGISGSEEAATSSSAATATPSKNYGATDHKNEPPVSPGSETSCGRTLRHELTLDLRMEAETASAVSSTSQVNSESYNDFGGANSMSSINGGLNYSSSGTVYPRSPRSESGAFSPKFRNVHLLADEEMNEQIIEQLNRIGLGADDDDDSETQENKGEGDEDNSKNDTVKNQLRTEKDLK